MKRHDSSAVIDRSAGGREPVPYQAGGRAAGTRVASILVKAIDDWFSKRDTCNRLLVLTYHRVLPEPDFMRDFDVDAACFRRQMELLARSFSVLPLKEAVEMLSEDRLPRRSVAISFDDGYADNCEVALPILAQVGLPAAFFVASGYLNGAVMWNDVVIEAVRNAGGPELDLRALGYASYRIRSPTERAKVALALLGEIKYQSPAQRNDIVDRIASIVGGGRPRNIMMDRVGVRRLHRAGMTIGAHTVTHPILARVSDEEAWREIVGAKDELQAIIGAPVNLFAYPNGRPGKDYTQTHVAMARRAGYSAAFSTSWGVADVHTNRFELPRLMPWDRAPWRFGLRLVRSYRAHAQPA